VGGDGIIRTMRAKESTRVAVVGDTHAYTFEKVPQEMIEIIESADWVIHVGDYTSKDVLNGFRNLKKENFKGVYGNADPQEVREELPRKDVLEVSGKRIGILHPAEGGPEEGVEERVRAEFKDDDVDVIVYGHIHEPRIEKLDDVLLLSPGKGYREDSYFGASTSVGILMIGEKEIKGEIQNLV
jgi:hypothetical protein